MQSRWPARRFVRALAVCLLTAGAISAIGPATASTLANCENWTGVQPPSPGTAINKLSAVIVLSPCNAWVAGETAGPGPETNLIEHWNGFSWKVVTTPNPGTGGSLLNGIRAISPANIWAVGSFAALGGDRAEVLHWNGHAWKLITTPAVGASDTLNAVRPVTANNIWAVGLTDTSLVETTLILHWNGHTWSHVPSPHPGRKWSKVPSPSGAKTDDVLEGMTVLSPGNAWAVGIRTAGAMRLEVILHWTGRNWQHVAVPKLTDQDFLSAVSASSGSDVWAVGDSVDSGGQDHALAVHCC